MNGSDFSSANRILWGRSSDPTELVGFVSSNTVLDVRTASNSLLSFTVPAVSLNAWHHVAVTRVSGVVHAYIDGTESSTGGLSDSGSMLIDLVGGFQSSSFYWKGQLDDAAILNGTGLTGSQVAAIAGTPGSAGSSTLDIATLTTVLLLRMEEGTGTTTADTSGHGNTGTFTGGVTWSSSVPAPLQSGGGGGGSRGLFLPSTLTGLGAGGSFFPNPLT